MSEQKRVELFDGDVIIGDVSESDRYGRRWIQVRNADGDFLLSPKGVQKIVPVARTPQVAPTFDDAKYDGDYLGAELNDELPAATPETPAT